MYKAVHRMTADDGLLRVFRHNLVCAYCSDTLCHSTLHAARIATSSPKQTWSPWEQLRRALLKHLLILGLTSPMQQHADPTIAA